MTFTTELTHEDHLASSLASEYGSGMHRRLRRRGLMYLAISIIGFAFSASVYINGVDREGAIIPFLLSCFFLVYAGILQGYYPRYMRKNYAAAFPAVDLGPYEITLDENGVSLRGEFVSSRVRWGAYISHQETDAYFFLFVGSANGHILPKRSMSPEQIEEARTIVSTQIPTVR